MKAAVYSENGGPEVFSFVERPDPVPGAGEVLIRVEAISVEGGDLLARRSVAPGDPPSVKGYVAAGRVAALGEGVSDLQLGERVTTFGFEGSHADLRVAARAHCWKIPDGLSSAEAAAALITFGTAALALDLAGTKAGDTVLVTGAPGGVGLASIQLASRLGAVVVGTGSSAETLVQLKPFGLDHGLVTGDGPIDQQVRSLLGHGVTSVIENVGGQAVREGMAALADGGTMVLVGLIDSNVQRISPVNLLLRRLTVRGCFLGPIMAQPAVSAMIDAVLPRIASGELVMPIDSIFPFAEVVAAHTRAEARGKLGRVVMELPEG